MRSKRKVRTFVPEILEDRKLLAVTFTIDPTQDVHPISQFIYGVNQEIAAGSNLTFERSGGNRWTAYNWENNASNAGADYYFQSDAYLGGGNAPAGALSNAITAAMNSNAASLITIPIQGYVSADKNNDGDVRYTNNIYNQNDNSWTQGTPNPNYLAQRFKVSLPAKGSAFTLTPDANDGFVYQDEFVNFLKNKYPAGFSDPNKIFMFDLDNEPDLWSSTHAEVHPNPVTYAEMISRSTDYAKAIKNVSPNSLVFGFVSYGWYGFVRLQDAPDGANRDFITFYLQEMKKAETAAGKRLVDVLDLHWYPEAHGTNDIRITSSDSSDATVAARLQAPRSLWDPTYVESSWITKDNIPGQAINLIPREKAKIDQNYPGTKLSFSEYNYGGGDHISGAIAEADVLGIFGREGIFSANEWPDNSGESYIAAAFKMFRNFNGSNGKFGDTSIRAQNSDTVNTSVYASYDAANPGALTAVAINKTNTANTATIKLNGVAAGSTATIYKLVAGNTNPQLVGTFTITDPNNFTYSMPAMSVSTIRVTPAVVGSISGTVFNDPNSNGIKEAGDSGIGAWKIYIDANNNNAFDAGEVSQSTDASGNYTFGNLSAGTYLVKQVFQAGYRKTLPSNGVQGYTVNLSAGQNVTTRDFGMTTNVLLAGTVFLDTNNNGVRDITEAGVANVTVDIISNGITVASRVTDQNGAWIVRGLSAGTGQAKIDLPPNYVRTNPGESGYIGSASSGQGISILNFGLMFTAPAPAQIFPSLLSSKHQEDDRDIVTDLLI